LGFVFDLSLSAPLLLQLYGPIQGSFFELH
jgi:hypothetical protein